MAVSFDRFSRTHEDLSANFAHFGEVECPQLDGHIYQALCRGVMHDKELLEMAAKAPATQPPANLLFAAVHYLLLAGEVHPLRKWYPALALGTAKESSSVFSPFRDFCLTHRMRIEELIETRLIQTNVIQRCSTLLPSLGAVFEADGRSSLSLIEIGSSAGLNLQWDRFFYRYGDGTTWGDSDSPVLIECELRGRAGLPALPEIISVGWRRGIDIHPVDIADPDQVLWLRALVWPDHAGRQERLTGALEIALKSPPVIVEGDASASLAVLIAEAPASTTLCVFGTHTLYQFSRDALIATLRSMQVASIDRTIHFLSVEATDSPNCELYWTVYKNGKRRTGLAARCSPHGRWLEWLE